MSEIQNEQIGGSKRNKSQVKRASILVIHQLSATLGVLLWAGLMANVGLMLPRLWGHIFVMDNLRAILVAPPFYPVQIVVGILWGWLVWNRFQHRVMFLVWIFPLIILLIEMLGHSTRTSSLYPGAVISNFRPMLSQFFGSSCRVEDHCFVQLGVTLPFYSAVSYAVGALFAMRFPIRSIYFTQVVHWTIITIAVLVLADTVMGILQSVASYPWWLVVFASAFQALMGVCLISFAFKLRRLDGDRGGWPGLRS